MQRQTPSAGFQRRFVVRLGHASVTVETPDRQEALRQARRRLCQDMPRLWDVIQRLPDEHFRIDEAH